MCEVFDCVDSFFVFEDVPFLASEGYVPVGCAGDDHFADHEEEHELCECEVVSCSAGYDDGSAYFAF